MGGAISGFLLHSSCEPFYDTLVHGATGSCVTLPAFIVYGRSPLYSGLLVSPSAIRNLLLVHLNETCLSEGGGFHFPPCHLLNVCGFRILFDCPVDLSALTIFSPIPTDSYNTLDEEASTYSSHKSLDSMCTVDQKKHKIEKPLDANNLIHAEPCYKTIKNLHLWDVCFIDIVLISSPMGMLGLPFLTRTKGFSAKIYATEATARFGQLMMEDLVAMQMELRQFYGPEDSDLLQWMKWEELEMLPLALREIALGKDGSELGGWMPLYSAADVKDCMQKVQALKFAEEVCYNGSLVIKAFSSGLEIGSCNWTINGPKRNIAYLLSSIFLSATAMEFDYHALQGSDMVIYSDFSSSNVADHLEDENSCPASSVSKFSNISDRDDNWEVIAESLLNADDSSEDMEKLAFICSLSIASVKAGGSVLIPIGRLGIILQLLEQIALSLDSSTLRVPIFIISSVAEELMAFSNIIPEWLCKHRQEKEPCIVFCPHWSLRLGPVVHLLQRWCKDQNSLLVMEANGNEGPSMFISLWNKKVQPLLKILQPKIVLFPENSRRHIRSLNDSFSFIHFSQNETLRIPSLSDCSELDIEKDLASQLGWIKLKYEDKGIARLKGELFMESGKQRLHPGKRHHRHPTTTTAVPQPPLSLSKTRPLLHWGMLNWESLVIALQRKGINVSVEQGMGDDESEKTSVLHIFEPNKALIEVKATHTVVSTADENTASLISEAICSILNGI